MNAKLRITIALSTLLLCPAPGINAATFEIAEPEEGSPICLLRFEITKRQLVDIYSDKGDLSPIASLSSTIRLFRAL